MQHADTDHVRFAAQLRVQVPRNADGTLEDGLRAVLDRSDADLDVETAELAGIVPRLNDLEVEARVTGQMNVGPDRQTPEQIAAQLEDTFGVAAVEQFRLRKMGETGRQPVPEPG